MSSERQKRFCLGNWLNLHEFSKERTDINPNTWKGNGHSTNLIPPLSNLFKLAFILLLFHNNHLSILPLLVLSESMCDENM